MKPTGDIGVYVHFPFCRRRCPYCDFRVDVVARIPHRVYADAVLSELASRLTESLASRRLRSVYLGGGTPSLWSPDQLGRVVARVRAAFAVRAEPLEVTVEANPEQVEPSRLSALLEAGMTRLSLGVQSFDDETLAWLGRDHSAERAHRALEWAVERVPNVSFDLISAIPGRSLERWRAELEAAARHDDVDHVSVYELTFHAGTPLGRRLSQGRVRPVASELAETILEQTRRWMAERGRHQYEVSNYARPGREAVHNGLYWQGAEYLGLGVGAHSMTVLADRVERRENTRQTAEYLAHPTAPPAMVEQPTAPDHLRERLFTGLRTRAGVDIGSLCRQLELELPETIAAGLARCVERGWLRRDGPRVRPTEAGLWMADSVALEVM